MKDILCGIDLGTTNSSIAYLRDGKPTVIDIEEGSGIVPSVVSLDEATQEILVGRVAKNRLAAFPDHTIRSIKRLMGKETRVSLGKQTFSPEEVSSFILKYLVQKASEKLGCEIRETVITVPAYFNDAQRRATIKAGELAGLSVSRIINEPTAASLVYDHLALGAESTSPYILVYDLGGGTLDVSILKINGEIKEVLASCGDTALGGDDFDERLTGFFLRHFKERTGIDSSFTDRALHVRLREIAERTKIALSDTPYVRVKEVAITTVQGAPFNLDLEIQRHDYEEMIGDLVQRTIDKVHEALREAHLHQDDIGKVILVGGATKTPLVMTMLAEMFDHPIDHSIDPDLCVAMGASVQNGLISGEPLGHILLDVTAHSLGVKTADEMDEDSGDADFFSVIIRRNTKVPVRKAEVYYTLFESQPGVDVEVYQGESRSCKQNTQIGSFFYPLKPSPAGSPVVAEFAYDKEGIVHITVDQKGYLNRKEVTLDVRKKTIFEDRGEVREQKILNYIIQKSRRLIEDEHLTPDLRGELETLTGQYEEALKSGEDDRLIDQYEDRLLEKMEEAEERLKALE